MNGALELGRRLAAGEVDAVAVAEDALARARASGCAFIALTEDRALREAAASAARLRQGAARGPLDGVPIAWKDLVDVEGVRTTAGSALRRDAPAARADAPIVAALAAAGMVCVGKTNLTEFAYSGLGLNPHFGTPPNPHDPARIPGGSSSGSAVAVATGVVPCAIGTDTSGSIRVPAAFCGIVGFKPTAARVDRTGVQPLSPTLDSVGPLATSVADAIALDALLRGAAPAAADRDAAPVRVVVPDGDLVHDVEPAVAEAFAAAVAALARAGFAIERKSLAALDDARALQDEHGSLVAHEAWRVHRKLLDSPDAADEAGEADAGDERAARGAIDRRVLRRLRDGRALPADGRDALLRERPLRQAALAAELDDALTLWPTVRHAAPRLEPLERDDDLFAEVNVGTLRATIPASYLDMPGIALPTGTDAAGLPLSALLSGPPGADDRVLAAALAAEAALRPGARAR